MAPSTSGAKDEIDPFAVGGNRVSRAVSILAFHVLMVFEDNEVF